MFIISKLRDDKIAIFAIIIDRFNGGANILMDGIFGRV
jgi:hypothetical protein